MNHDVAEIYLNEWFITADEAWIYVFDTSPKQPRPKKLVKLNQKPKFCSLFS